MHYNAVNPAIFTINNIFLMQKIKIPNMCFKKYNLTGEVE